MVSANAKRAQMGLSSDGCLTSNALAHAQTMLREKCRPTGHVTVVVLVTTASPRIRQQRTVRVRVPARVRTERCHRLVATAGASVEKTSARGVRRASRRSGVVTCVSVPRPVARRRLVRPGDEGRRVSSLTASPIRTAPGTACVGRGRSVTRHAGATEGGRVCDLWAVVRAGCRAKLTLPFPKHYYVINVINPQ